MELEHDQSDLIGVDFDGTLTDPDQDEWQPAEECEPNEQVVEMVREAYFNGAHIVVWTARQWTEAAQIVGWLNIHEVPFHGIRCGKGGADKYIDDKAVEPPKPKDDPLVFGEEVMLTVEKDSDVAARVTESPLETEYTGSFELTGTFGETEPETPDYMAMDGSRNY